MRLMTAPTATGQGRAGRPSGPAPGRRTRSATGLPVGPAGRRPLAALNARELWSLLAESGACARLDRPDDMFPEPGDAAAVQRALAICAGCPVRAYCAERARRTASTHGVWAGRLLTGQPHGRDEPCLDEPVHAEFPTTRGSAA